MAEGFIYGVDGVVRVGTKTMSDVNSWTANVTPGVAMTGGIGCKGPHRDYTKWVDWTGTITCPMKFDPLATATVAAEDIQAMFVNGSTAAAVQLSLIESSKSMFFGNVVFTGMTKDMTAGDLEQVTFNWAQADGPLYWSSDTST